MRISPLSHNPIPTPPPGRLSSRVAPNPAAEAHGVTTGSATPPTTTDFRNDDPRGILQYLNTGRFRGVDNITHRTDTAGKSIEEHTSALLDSLSDPLGTILGSTALTDAQKSAVAEHQRTFTDATDNLRKSLADGTLDPRSLPAELQRSFNAYIADVKTSTAPASDAQLQNLTSTFNDGLASLTQSLTARDAATGKTLAAYQQSSAAAPSLDVQA